MKIVSATDTFSIPETDPLDHFGDEALWDASSSPFGEDLNLPAEWFTVVSEIIAERPKSLPSSPLLRCA